MSSTQPAQTTPRRYQLFIDGHFVDAESGKTFKSPNPATGETFAEVAEADKADVDKAVAAARKAMTGKWSKMSARDRGRLLYKLSQLIERDAAQLAELETRDNGKPIKESTYIDLPGVVENFEYFAGWPTKIEGETIPVPGQMFNYTLREPVGVCGQIIPWNFPLLMAAWKIAPALACGNTVVLKPAETTSITAMQLARIFQEAELPEGVVNIITGAGETGAALVNHPDIDKLAFTGSTEVGKLIARTLAQRSAELQPGLATPKSSGKKAHRAPKLTLELGGKAANIVFEDAPIDQAIEGVIAGIYFNQGHVCCAGSRLFVQEGIYPTMIRKLRQRIQTLRVGNPLDKNTDIGAINSRPQLEKIRALVQNGLDEGAELEQSQCALPARGYWYPPTFLTGVTSASRVAQEEIFGPVLSVMTFRTPEEAFERANNTPYGLSAGVWTDKGSKIFKMVNQLRAGVVWANTFNKFDPTSPFGGYKESGFGREGGRHGLLPYLTLD